MKLSEVFGFLEILNESIKLVPKTGKFMVSITILSLLVPSIIFLLFSYYYQSLMNDINNSIMYPFEPDFSYIPYHQLGLLFLAVVTFLLAYVVISHISATATIYVAAMTYTNKKLSLQDLYSEVKRTWRRQLAYSFRRSNNPTRCALFAEVLAYFLAIFYPNAITIFIAVIVGISAFVVQLYSSSVLVLSYIVSVVEESREALEKAEQLLGKGQRLHGFMLNLFFNLLVVINFLSYWMILGDKGLLDVTIFGLFIVSSASLVKIFGCIVYTVLYFQCKKHQGEEIDII